jgi:isoamylase
VPGRHPTHRSGGALSPLAAGRPYPLGATLRDGGVNFAVYAGHADAVELCLFDALGP